MMIPTMAENVHIQDRKLSLKPKKVIYGMTCEKTIEKSSHVIKNRLKSWIYLSVFNDSIAPDKQLDDIVQAPLSFRALI